MVPDPTPIYHITQVDNLSRIAAAGGLAAKNLLLATGQEHSIIAYDHIQERRARKQVRCGPRGTLHDYVPFYFASRSPMLYAIRGGLVLNCPADQTAIVHLASTVQAVSGAGLRCVFTEGHATVAFSQYFDDLARLDQVDWEVMRSQYWNDTNEYPDRKRRRQAEFLVYRFVPWELIQEVGVCTPAVRARVEEVVKPLVHRPPVSVRRDWYY
jgi:hypothetical protein